MTEFDCGCRIMTDIIVVIIKKTFLELLAQNVCECLREVWQETNEIPIYGK